MWKTVKLGDVSTVIAGQSPAGENYNKEGIGTPFMQGKKDYGDKFPNPSTVWTTSVTKLAEKGDILMSVRAPVGALNIANQQVCIGRGLAAIRASEDILLDYLFYALLQISAKLEGRSGAIFNSINKKQIEEIEFMLPPLVEQQRIVAKLDAAFAEIDKAIKINQKALSSADIMFSKYKHSIFEKIASNSEFKKMGEYYDVRDGTHDSPKYVEVGYPLVTSKNLKTGTLDLTKVKYISETDYNQIRQRSAVDVGDILMAMIGTIGNPIVIYDPPEFAIKNVALFKVNQNIHFSEFLKFFLLHSTKKLLNDANGTTQKFVSLGYLREMQVPVIPLEKQKEFAENLSNVEQTVENRKRTLTLKSRELANLKSAILAQELSSEAA